MHFLILILLFDLTYLSLFHFLCLLLSLPLSLEEQDRGSRSKKMDSVAVTAELEVKKRKGNWQKEQDRAELSPYKRDITYIVTMRGIAQY